MGPLLALMILVTEMTSSKVFFLSTQNDPLQLILYAMNPLWPFCGLALAVHSRVSIPYYEWQCSAHMYVQYINLCPLSLAKGQGHNLVAPRRRKKSVEKFLAPKVPI